MEKDRRGELIREAETIRQRMQATADISERQALKRRYQEIREALEGKAEVPPNAETDKHAKPLEEQKPPISPGASVWASGGDATKIPFAPLARRIATIVKALSARKYTFLGTVAFLFGMYSALAFAASIWTIYVILWEGLAEPESPILWASLAVTILVSLLCGGISEGIRLAISIEDNTRRTAEATENFLARQS